MQFGMDLDYFPQKPLKYLQKTQTKNKVLPLTQTVTLSPENCERLIPALFYRLDLLQLFAGVRICLDYFPQKTLKYPQKAQTENKVPLLTQTVTLSPEICE